MKLIVTIDREDCIACALCWEACPEFFEENPDDGFSRVARQYRRDDHLGLGRAPSGLKDCVVDAAEQCPVEVIQIEEEPP